MSIRWSEDDLRAHLRRNSAVPLLLDAAAEPAARVKRAGRAPEMNKTEAAYAQVLEMRLRAGEIHWYGFERMKLRLADKTFYTPDFSVLLPNLALEFHEVKGKWEDDARVKIKVAAAQYPFRFLAVTKARKRDGGAWHYEIFG